MEGRVHQIEVSTRGGFYVGKNFRSKEIRYKRPIETWFGEVLGRQRDERFHAPSRRTLYQRCRRYRASTRLKKNFA